MCGWGTVLGVSKSRLLQDLNSDQEPLECCLQQHFCCPQPLTALGQWHRQALLSQAGIFFPLKLSG